MAQRQGNVEDDRRYNSRNSQKDRNVLGTDDQLAPVQHFLKTTYSELEKVAWLDVVGTLIVQTKHRPSDSENRYVCKHRHAVADRVQLGAVSVCL